MESKQFTEVFVLRKLIATQCNGSTNRDAGLLVHNWQWAITVMNEDGEANARKSSSQSILQTVNGCTVDLYNHYHSTSAFLICSGPSIKDVDLSCLNSRGMLTCTVNNSGTMYRSNIWIAYDYPGNFSDAIWRDPGTLKFIPTQRLQQTIRVRDKDGKLIDSDLVAGRMPATIGYRTNRSFRPEHWLTEDSINCGDDKPLKNDDNEQYGTRSVMLAAIRLLHFLGVRRLFLLGCDFRMSYGVDNYGFPQSRSRKSVRQNNQIYRTLSEKFKFLLPYFQKAKFEIFNCTPNSGLTVFPFLDLPTALKMVTSNMPPKIETEGMYE